MAKKQAANKKRRAKAEPDPPDAATKRRARSILKKLYDLYPDAECALEHKDPFELLVATILSAQCTDVQVNKITPKLFDRYPDPQSMAKAKRQSIEKLIQSTGFFRNKAKSIKGASEQIVEDHDGNVPDTMEELLELPGVARKTANVVLGNAFDKNVGVVVDTHVGRLARRLGFTEEQAPEKVERDLMALFPRKHWTMLSHLLIFHGRQVCNARKPKCKECKLKRQCPRIGVDEGD